MDLVNLYIYTTVRGPGTRSGSYTWLLEYNTKKGPATLTKSGELENATEHQADLMVLTEALERIRRPCEIQIYFDSDYLKSGAQKWIRKWKAEGWVTARGKPVANREEWEKASELLERNLVVFRTKESHPYREWLRKETERKERQRCLRDSGNLTRQRR